MDTKEIAAKLVELCNAGQNMTAVETLYADNIVSTEAGPATDAMHEVTGIEAVKGKGHWWYENHEVHSGASRGPWVNGDSFVVEHTYDITFKPTGVRRTMNETALYEVRDGKIAKETFFYGD
jgi:ketosteroid isomerase-like protein